MSNSKKPSKGNKKTSFSDPWKEQEQKRYENPIASRESLLKLLGSVDIPLSYDAIATQIGINSWDEENALHRRLRAMVRDGQIQQHKNSDFAVLRDKDLIQGRVQGHRDGYGFLIPDDREKEDIFLHAKEMQRVLDGDIVKVSIKGINRQNRVEGAVVSIVERRTKELVGRFYQESGMAFVTPDNARFAFDVKIKSDTTHKAETGQYVVVRITRYPAKNIPAMGEIIEVLGDFLAPGVEIDVALRRWDIPCSWSEALIKQVADIAPEVEESDKKHRVDLRHLPFVTIDGEDARDFDDAVYCEPTKTGWLLRVAIADVSHYVKPGSELDREAELRATSVYFPGMVVPMLPEVLSNGLCSLNPGVDRLTLVCEITLNKAGGIIDYSFCEAVICSHHRLTYNQVGDMLIGRDSVIAEHKEVFPHISALHDLYKVLRVRRTQRGAIDFESTETRIIFNEDRKIARIVPVVRNDAHKLIEECMLCANVCAAMFFQSAEVPALYRVHQGPSEEKLADVRKFLGELGLWLGGGDKPIPGNYQQLLEMIGDRPDKAVIQTVLLRSLSQAVYQSDNEGHFGLAYEGYTHFTSPIRRYPDLLVHRAIRRCIRSKENFSHVTRVTGAKPLALKHIYPYDEKQLQKLGEHCSMAERRADDATRDVAAWLKCEYLQDHVEEDFTGIITAVTSFGCFVELQDIFVEGLVHITALGKDYYQYDKQGHRLVGEHTRTVFRLGDTVQVKVVRVDLDDRKIDLELVGTPSRGVKDKGQKPKKQVKNTKPPAKGKRRSNKKRSGKGQE